tara:strand:+ start:1685 stop:5851 length:4167 start_codon:yes stop_codon:yes gene_type:complete
MAEPYNYSSFISEIDKEREAKVDTQTEVPKFDYNKFTTEITKERAEKAGINFDDDKDASPLLKRKTAEEMDVTNYTKSQAIGFAARLGATDTIRGASQITGIGAEETKKEQLMLNELMQNEEYGGYVTAAYFGGLIADPAGWVIPFAKARSVYKMAKYGLVGGGIAGATGYVDDELDSLVSEGKMTRTEQTMIGVVGGGVLAPVAGGVANAVKYMRGKPLIPLREKIIPEKTVEPNIIPVKEAELRQRWVDEGSSELMTLDEFAIKETGKPLTIIDDVAEQAVKRPSILDDTIDTAVDIKVGLNKNGTKTVKKYEQGVDFDIKVKNMKVFSPIHQFYKDLKEGHTNIVAQRVFQEPFGAIGAVTGGVYGYKDGVPWIESEEDMGISQKLMGALLGFSMGAVIGTGLKKIPYGSKTRSSVGEAISYGFIDRFGIKNQKEYKALLTRLRADQGNFFGRVGESLTTLEKLGPEENKIMYRMLVGEVSPISPADTRLASIMGGLTAEQQKKKLDSLVEIKTEVRESITELGQKMVDYGLLDPKTFKDNMNTYLHRRYVQHEDLADRYIKDPKKRILYNQYFKESFSEIKTQADELKPRGLLETISAKDWYDKYSKIDSQFHLTKISEKMGLDELAEAQNIKLKIMEEDAMHKGWEIFSRDIKLKDGKLVKTLEDGTEKILKDSDKVKVRWQLSKAQRMALGEIEDASAAIFETGKLMSSDIAVTKFYDDLAKTTGFTEKQLFESGLTQAKINKNYTMIPDTTVGDTKIKLYGTAAGKYVPNAVAYDLEKFNRYRKSMNVGGKTDFSIKDPLLKNESLQGLARGYTNMHQLWKKTKTAYNPAVHTNNIMSNMVLFDLAIVGRNLGNMSIGQYHAKYLKEALNELTSKGPLYKLAERQGVFEKDFLRQENSEINEYINKMYKGAFDKSKDLEGVGASMMNRAGKFVDFANKYTFNAAEQLYRKEDHLFRLAIFKQRLDLAASAKVIKDSKTGQNIIEGGLEMQQRAGKVLTNFEKQQLQKIIAGDVVDLDKPELKYVRDIVDHATEQGIKWFIDYDIQAPMINAARASALPFVAYTYRVVPLLAESALTNPAKYVKWAALGTALGIIGHTFGKGDTKMERNYMSTRDQEKVYGMPFLPYRMIKVPITIGGNPTYIDITRWTPGGDIFQVADGRGSWPGIPEPLQPSFGGLGAIISSMMGYDPFTGQTFPGLGAPGWFDFNTKLSNLAYEFIPNVAIIPGTYANAKVVKAFQGNETAYTDNLTVVQALLDTFGVKLKPANLKKLQARKQAELGRKLQAYQEQLQDAYSRYARRQPDIKNFNGFDQEDYNKEINKILKEREKLVTEYREIFAYDFTNKKDDPLLNGFWPLATQEQLNEMYKKIWDWFDKNKLERQK